MKSPEHAAELGMTRIILEMDVALAKVITSTELDRSTFSCLFTHLVVCLDKSVTSWRHILYIALLLIV
jgi:hypothetical protein